MPTPEKLACETIDAQLGDVGLIMQDLSTHLDWSGATSTTRQGCPEGERGGAHQFYTLKCVVNLVAELIEPNHGRVYDPEMGSGGFFVGTTCEIQMDHFRHLRSFISGRN